MTLHTSAAGGLTWYYVINLTTGETIELRPCDDSGQFADYPMSSRYGHQEPAPLSQTGVASWRLGSRSTFVVLSAADIAVIYTPVNGFGSTGALAAQVVTCLADQTTVVRQSNNAARLGASPTPQLEIVQGGNSVFLTQQNCADLASTLNTIGAT
jgi:hypothetical protein